ncbi:hypothetical protein DNI29_01930 [Hymenobacter sediminis]|uniref:class I SAM-dependent methyltransferase n=1 Tax=Hymenobacter sediminis TaxID=2218621 RepID=UPI000F50F776|nr:class I SAM-dependent methyltransferase [Hymenobacter sediminis]RPD49585.1 hypothetical protein DNI29_01930 [Hymenobacter sediminis]
MSSSAKSPLCVNQEALSLLVLTDLPLEAPILDLGAGISTFLDALLIQGYTNLIAADVSAAALDAHRRQLSAKQVEHVLWLVDDVTHADELRTLSPILLWHDRAMLPLLCLPQQQRAYCEVLDHMVEPGKGWVLLSVDLPGEQASPGDLPRQPYTLADLVALLGSDYVLHEQREYVQELANGVQLPGIYALFRRREQTSKPFRQSASSPS